MEASLRKSNIHVCSSESHIGAPTSDMRGKVAAGVCAIHVRYAESDRGSLYFRYEGDYGLSVFWLTYTGNGRNMALITTRHY